MKTGYRMVAALVAAGGFLAAGGIAQAAQSGPTSEVTGTTAFTTSDGIEVTVRSLQPTSATTTAPPAFANLDINDDGFLDQPEASAYPPLANDFIFADLNHDGRVSKSEYAWWVKQP